MQQTRLFEYGGHWLTRRSDTKALYIYWCRPGTRRVQRRSTGTTDLDEAKRRLIAFADGRPTQTVSASARRTDPTVLELLHAYVNSLGPERAWADHAKRCLCRWKDFLSQQDVVYVPELTLGVQERFVEWRRKQLHRTIRRCSNWTIHHDLATLKASLRYGWKQGLLSHTPFIISLPKPPSRDRFLTAEEAVRLLTCCTEPHLYRFVLLMLHTLQRPVSIYDLRCEQVDLVHGTINFLPKGNVQSSKRRPVVPITQTLRPELERALADSVSGYVVEYNFRRVGSVKKSFQEACRRAGIAKASPYTLRYTGATLLCAAGVPMREVAGMLGHSHERTTEIYAKFRPEFLRTAAATLDVLFSSSTSSGTSHP